MSSTRREVVFSARTDEVSQKLSRVQQQAEEMTRESIAGAMKTEQSATKVIAAYEKQINLLQRMNKLDSERRKNDLYSERDDERSKATTVEGKQDVDKKFGERFSELAKDTRGDKEGILVLRDILAAIKDGDESIVDSNVDMSQQTTEQLKQMVTGGGAGQKSALHELKLREIQGKGKGGGGGQSAMGLLKGGVGGLAALGIAGVAIGGFLKLMKGGWDAGRDREIGLSDYSAMSGQGNDFLSKYTNAGRGSGLYNKFMYGGNTSAQSLGFSKDEYFQQITSGTKAYGGSRGVTEDNNRTIQGLSLRRGLGMEQGVVNTLERLTRTLEGDDTAAQTTQRIFSTMFGTGAFGDNNRDMTRMNELAQSYAQFQEQQFSRTGLIGGGNEWLNVRGQLEGLGGAYKRDDYAASTIESLSGGLANQGGPEVQAIKMDILRKKNPKMSYFELQAEMEKGISAEGFGEGMMDFVKGTGGDLNSQAILMDQMTGGTMRKQDILNMLKGDVSLSSLGVEAETKDMKLMEKARGATSDKDSFMKNIESDWDSIKEAIFNISTGTTGMNNSLTPLIQALMASY
tara:strand:- start:80671 stop:82386 length:1716 start_codon:yes stop_codon:yes gene_type:complete